MYASGKKRIGCALKYRPRKNTRVKFTVLIVELAVLNRGIIYLPFYNYVD